MYTTRKISNLLLDINWQHSYKLECNTIDIPITINYNELLIKFDNLINANIDMIYDFKNEYNIAIDNFNNIFLEKLAYQKLNNKSKIIQHELDNITENNRTFITYEAVEKFCNKYNYSDFRLIKDIKLQDTIIKIVSYYLTNGTINSKYNYGLAEKMFNINYNYKEEWEWIINDCKNSSMTNNPDGLINLNYIDQNDYSGAHRSGWQYVFENIKHLHNYNGIIMDMSIDKTFHWNADINKILNIIPYTKPWVGFVHHTFDTTFSDYNCNTLLQSVDFKESLNFCKGIIVLSNDLKNKFIANGINNVYSIIHPTTVDVIKFKFNNFITNPDKKIIYIGGWLRNTYNFYNITIPPMKFNHYCYKNIYSLEKVALKGQLEFRKEQNELMFFGTLWIDHYSKMMEIGLTYTDFPAYDPIFDIQQMKAVLENEKEDIHKLKSELNIINHSADLFLTLLPSGVIKKVSLSSMSMMDYDCRAFGQHNTCISFGGRYGDLNASANEGAGILTLAYRVSPSVRIGAFIDHRVTQSKPAGINYSDDTPSVGTFVAYDDRGNGTGMQGKLTAVYNTGKVGVTRLASSANTEAGSGRSSLTSYAVGAELGWGFKVNEGWVATPYAGLKHTSSKLGSYAESQTASVEFPISYADYGQRLTTATAGFRLDGRMTERVSLALAAGMEHDLRSAMDAYAGTSDMPTLTSFSLSTNANRNRSRMVGSAALSYQIAAHQRVTAGMHVRENAYVTQPTRTAQMTYEMAF